MVLLSSELRASPELPVAPQVQGSRTDGVDEVQDSDPEESKNLCNFIKTKTKRQHERSKKKALWCGNYDWRLKHPRKQKLVWKLLLEEVRQEATVEYTEEDDQSDCAEDTDAFWDANNDILSCRDMAQRMSFPLESVVYVKSTAAGALHDSQGMFSRLMDLCENFLAGMSRRLATMGTFLKS